MPPTRRPLTVLALLAALFMAAMEMTVVSTAMPTVVGDLGGIELYAWVFSAYLLASTVFVPLFGKLADIYGRKPVFLAGVILFLAGSLACGLAASMHQLIAFRLLQGVGAGALQPVSMTIIGDLFDLRERARIQGIFGAVWGFAGLVGPLLGALIVKLLTWRWVFLINLPFGLAALAIISGAFHEQVAPRQHPLDLAGASLLCAIILALLVGAHGGTARLGLAVGLALLFPFLAVERRAAEPVLPLDLFRQRIITLSSILGAVIGAAMLATVTYVPLYVQGVLRGTPAQAGAAIAPMVIGWPIASAVAGRLLVRVGYRRLIQGGLLLSAVAGMGLALLLRPDASLALPRVATLVYGLGLGFANTALLIAIQTSVPWARRGVATASTMFFRSIGGTLAVGALGGALAASLAAHPELAAAARDLLAPHGTAPLDPLLLARLGATLADALRGVFTAVGVLAVAAFLLSLAFPREEGGGPAAVPVTVGGD